MMIISQITMPESRVGPLLVVALLLLLVAGQQVSARPKSKCSESRDAEMDTCASRMGFLGDHSFRVPKNSSSMSEFCQELKKSIGCIQSYSRDCLQGFTRQILLSLMKRGKQQYNLVCQDDQAKQEFRNKMACMADDKIEQLHSCMDASVARFEHIRGQVRPEHRIQSLCCSYQIFVADLDATMDRVCGPRQGSDGAGESKVHAFVQRVVTGTTGEFFQLVCDNHRSMAECRASDKTREVLRKLEQVTRNAKSGKLKPRSKSLIPPLLDILDSSDQS